MNNRQPPPQPEADAQPDAGTPRSSHSPTDTRRARRRQERQLLGLVTGVLVVVGGALIALVYGPRALFTAIPCLLAGAGAIFLLYLLFLLAERWVNR